MDGIKIINGLTFMKIEEEKFDYGVYLICDGGCLQ